MTFSEVLVAGFFLVAGCCTHEKKHFDTSLVEILHIFFELQPILMLSDIHHF